MSVEDAPENQEENNFGDHDLSDKEENEEEDEEVEDEDDDLAQDNMDQIRRILNMNNETLLSHLAQSTKKGNRRQNVVNKKVQKQITGLLHKQFQLNDKIDEVEKKIDNKESIQCLTDRVDQNKKVINQNKQNCKKIEKKYNKLKREMKELTNKLFSASIPSDNKPNDFKALLFWMTVYGKFNEELKKKLIENHITSFDKLKNVSFEYLLRLNIPLHQIPNIVSKIKSIQSGDIAKCTKQSLQCKVTRTGSILMPNVCGFQPRYDCIKLSDDSIPKSKFTEIIYDETAKITGDLDEMRLDFEELKDVALYRDLITDFITMNKIGNIAPNKINMGSRDDLPPSAGTRRKRNEQEQYYKFDKLSDLIGIKKCRRSHTNHLKGKKGVYAKKDIPINTILGEYIGVLYLEKEWENIFQNTMEKSNHERYTIKMKKKLAVSFKILEDIFGDNRNEDIEMKMSEENKRSNHNKRNYNEMDDGKDNNEECGHKKRKLNDSSHIKAERVKMYEKTFILIVDPLRLKQLKPAVESALWEINDCREYLYMDRLSVEDEERRNVKCITCFVNNWPTKFIINDKEIKANTELLSFCGRGYEDNMYAQRRDAQFRSRIQ